MIHLSYLKAHTFKQLRDVELHFPERCCALVEGLNEAGKSTLFEAIYFALYGKGLAMRGKGQGERASLIAHKESSAVVELGIRVGDTQLNISRKINRSGGSEAEVVVITPDGEETIRRIRDVNEEILVRLNRLDADALLSSCFVQQKKLGQLEELGRGDRQAILLKLLNMDRVTKLKDSFKWTITDDRNLQTARRKYRLAEITQMMRQLREGIERIERLLAMAEIHARIEEMESHDQQANAARLSAEGFRVEAEKLATEISYIEALGKISQFLDQNIKTRDAITARQREKERVYSELTKIDVYERETLPALLRDAETLKQLEQVIEEIATLETKRYELLERSKRLSASIESADALKVPTEEVTRLKALKLQAEEERRQLEEKYEITTKLEGAKDQLARLDIQIKQEQERKARLSSVVLQAEDLTKRKQAAKVLKSEWNNARVTTEEARSKVASAMRIEELEGNAKKLEELARASSGYHAQLIELRQQSSRIGDLKQGVFAAREQLATSNLRLETAKEAFSRIAQSNALTNWAEARRDLDARMLTNNIIADNQSKVDEARIQTTQAEKQERAGRLQMMIGGLTATAGIIMLVVAFFSLAILAVVGGLLTLTGAILAFRGRTTSASGTNNRQSAENDISKFDRQMQGETIKRDLLLSRPPLDFAAARAHLIELRLDEPQSAGEAEEKEKVLAVVDRNRLTSNLSQEQANVREVEKSLFEQEQRLRVDEENLTRQLNTLNLLSVDDLQQAIDATLQQRVEQLEQREKLLSEIFAFEKTLPSQYDLTDLKQSLKEREGREKTVELEFARIQSEVSSVEKQISDLLLSEGIPNVEETQGVISKIEADVADCLKQKSELEKTVDELTSSVPDGLTSGELYIQLNEAFGKSQRLEREVTEKQARIDSENERITLNLKAENVTSLDEARFALEQIAPEEQALAISIGKIWEGNRESFSRWDIPLTVKEAKQEIASASSTVRAEINRINEAINTRTELEQQKILIEEELRIYEETIDNNYKQLKFFCDMANFEKYLITAERSRQGEKELLNEIQLRLALEDLDDIKLNHQRAIESKATELSKAKQYDLQSIEAQRVAQRFLRGMGVSGITTLHVDTISEHLRDFTDVKASDRISFQTDINELNAKAAVMEDEADKLEQTLQVIRTEVEIELCRHEFEELERHNTVCSHASNVLDRVRENILQSVLPNTLNYMRKLLPLLTSGRYHDAELDDDTYKIRVWDNRAGEYIEKDIFSGATQDQFSLALRLAFALATLPQGLGAQPKFIFLDEPTAGFDGERREAFVNLLTKGYLSEQFDQIFLISPEGVYNTNPLPDVIRIVKGRIIGENISAKATM